MLEYTPPVYPPLVYIPGASRRICTIDHVHVTYQGKTLTYREWAITLGFSRHVIYDRLKRYGWTLEDAMTPKRHLHFGKLLVEGIGEVMVAKKKKSSGKITSKQDAQFDKVEAAFPDTKYPARPKKKVKK